MCKYGAWRSLIVVFSLAFCLMESGCKTCLEYEGGTDDACAVSSEAKHDTLRKLNAIIIPEMSVFAPATLADAVEFLKQASREHDRSKDALAKQGVVIDLRLPGSNTGNDAKDKAPAIPALSLRAVSLFDALKVLCEVTGMKFRIRGDDGRVMIVPHDGDEDWATRSYSIPPALSERLFNPPEGQAVDPDSNKVWHAFFEELGVTGPDFAKFEYLPVIDKLRVTNTPENLAVIEMVFEQIAVRMIEVEMQIHAFRVKDIERLRLAGGVSVETLMALRRKGKGKPVATATARTKSGQEAVVKAVREVLYPTELLTDGSQTGSNVTARSAAGALIPSCFEMRETGMILQVVPEVSPGSSLINLMLNPEWVTLEGWESYPADNTAGWTHKTLALRQPVFGRNAFQTQATVADGGTVLLGSCSTPDGEWVQAGFLTVRLQGVGPEIAGRMRGSEKRADPSAASLEKKMKDIVIPEMTFRPPATIIDAMAFFAKTSRDYDNPEVPEAQRGLSFALKLPPASARSPAADGNVDPFAPSAVPATTNVVPVISALSARFINLHDALKLVCDVTGMKFWIRDGIIWVEPLDEPDHELITRIYPVLTSLCERMSGAGIARFYDWKTFFAQMGVNWPAGSSIKYLRCLNRLHVTNTPENLAVFEKVLVDLVISPLMVEVEMQVHAFRPEDIETLRLSGDVSVASLTALRQKGRSRPVASASVLTRSGQEAIMRCVREVIYPTELDSDGGLTGLIGSSGDGAKALMPCSFEMREVGMILHVFPEVSSVDPSLIDLILNPQWVTLDRWETVPAGLAAGWTHKTLLFRQPVFGVTSFQTQITVADGDTVLLGTSATPDGKWVHVGFLAVKRVNVPCGDLRKSP